MYKFLLILLTLTFTCRNADSQNLTAKDYIIYYQFAAMQGQGSEPLFKTIHEKMLADTSLDQNTQDYKTLKKLDAHYINYFKFKQSLIKHLNGYQSKQNLDTRILAMIKFGEKFKKETVSSFEKENYEKQYNESYLEGFFTPSDDIKNLPAWQKFIYEAYGQALENAIISYVKMLSFEKELLDSEKEINISVINEIWEKFDRFMPIHNQDLKKIDNKINNNKLNYASNDIVSSKTIEDPRIKFWNKKIKGAVFKIASKKHTNTNTVLAETTKKIQEKAIDINYALYRVNNAIKTNQDIYNENADIFTLFKITQKSLDSIKEYQAYINNYLAAVAEGPGMLLITKTMSDESSNNPYNKSAIGGIRMAEDFNRGGTTLPVHNMDPESINNSFVKAVIFEAENNIILTMDEFKNTISEINNLDKQLDHDVLMELITFFPEAVALTIDKHPEYNTDEISTSIASSIISIDSKNETKNTNRKIWMWAGVGAGTVCLVTGILSWVGSGLISASVATGIAVSATIFGLIDTGYQHHQMNEYESSYNLFHDSYFSGNIDVQSIKDAKMELEAFESARLSYYISAGCSVLNATTFLVDLRYLAFAKSDLPKGGKELIAEIGKNLDKYKLRIAGKLYSHTKLTKKLLAVANVEDSENFILMLSKEIAETKNVESINKATLSAINKILSLDTETLKGVINNATTVENVKILSLLQASKGTKIASEVTKGMGFIKEKLNNQKAFDNFMKYFNQTVNGKKANELLRIQVVQENTAINEINKLDFLYKDYSPDYMDDFSNFLTKWKQSPVVSMDLSAYDTTLDAAKFIEIYKAGDEVIGDLPLFLAQPENKEIILKLLETMNPMGKDDVWTLLSNLDKAEPFLYKLRILKNEPIAAQEILEELKDIITKNPKSLLKADNTLDVDKLCKMVDNKVLEIGPMTANEMITSVTENNRVASILWYPRFSPEAEATHAKISLNGTAYTTIKEKFSAISYSTLKKAATLLPKEFGFYKININITEEEALQMSKVIQSIASDPEYSSNCVNLCSNVINRSTSFKIPKNISDSPLLSAAYLKAAKMLGFKRVGSIEFVGQEQFNSIFRSQTNLELLRIGFYSFLSIGKFAVAGLTVLGVIRLIDNQNNEVPAVLDYNVIENDTINKKDSINKAEPNVDVIP